MAPSSQERAGFIFTIPWLVTFAAFGLFPVLFSLGLSFSRFNPARPGATHWVGLANYAELAADGTFWQSVGNTAFFAMGTIPFTTGIALALALLLHSRPPAGGFFRTALFVPTVISLVVVSLIFRYVYAPIGMLNAFLGWLGIGGKAWLQDPNFALPAIMAMDVWAAVGYYMILMLAGLKAIPREIYDSAEVDGAGWWARLWHITLPGLRPMLLFVVVINTIRSLQVFVEIVVMTQGGPLNRTLTVVYYLYETAFYKLRMGYGSAIAYALFAILFVVTLVQLRAFRFSRAVGE
ncbi:MAG: sugar ABC transporter permease [Candidatus Eisenbacteria sp.]|nr:sugar ABC transporter permease [Candidatus Eisenbacteria bacterium]